MNKRIYHLGSYTSNYTACGFSRLGMKRGHTWDLTITFSRTFNNTSLLNAGELITCERCAELLPLCQLAETDL